MVNNLCSQYLSCIEIRYQNERKYDVFVSDYIIQGLNVMNIKEISYHLCTGCKMCEDLCPSNAIGFTVDKQGFWYPYIEDNKCTQCGLCYKRCPINGPYRKVDNINPVVYSLWSKDENTRLTSTSGGAFWEFAKWFIDNKGVVVGSRYRDDWRSCEHFIATNHTELNELKGSKYFQSDTSGI